MSVTSVFRDYANLTITLIADFDAPIQRVWELWSDPHKLERWLGPPTHPASVEKHDLTPGGEITFFMTGPDGDRSWGTWRVTALDPPTLLAFTDAFADTDGTPIATMPVSQVRVQLTEHGGRTRMEMRMAFESHEDMEQSVDMGTVEGLQHAVGQMDALVDPGRGPMETGP
jgi:uncharacterized protein YndB with AHSA1/START domain